VQSDGQPLKPYSVSHVSYSRVNIDDPGNVAISRNPAICSLATSQMRC